MKKRGGGLYKLKDFLPPYCQAPVKPLTDEEQAALIEKQFAEFLQP